MSIGYLKKLNRWAKTMTHMLHKLAHMLAGNKQNSSVHETNLTEAISRTSARHNGTAAYSPTSQQKVK